MSALTDQPTLKGWIGLMNSRRPCRALFTSVTRTERSCEFRQIALKFLVYLQSC